MTKKVLWLCPFFDANILSTSISQVQMASYEASTKRGFRSFLMKPLAALPAASLYQVKTIINVRPPRKKEKEASFAYPPASFLRAFVKKRGRMKFYGYIVWL